MNINHGHCNNYAQNQQYVFSLSETDVATSPTEGATCQKETTFLIPNWQNIANYHTHSGLTDFDKE